MPLEVVDQLAQILNFSAMYSLVESISDSIEAFSSTLCVRNNGELYPVVTGDLATICRRILENKVLFVVSLFVVLPLAVYWVASVCWVAKVTKRVVFPALKKLALSTIDVLVAISKFGLTILTTTITFVTKQTLKVALALFSCLETSTLRLAYFLCLVADYIRNQLQTDNEKHPMVEEEPPEEEDPAAASSSRKKKKKAAGHEEHPRQRTVSLEDNAPTMHLPRHKTSRFSDIPPPTHERSTVY